MVAKWKESLCKVSVNVGWVETDATAEALKKVEELCYEHENIERV